MDHRRDSGERLTELSEDEAAVAVHDLHVHEAARTPAMSSLLFVCCRLFTITDTAIRLADSSSSRARYFR